MLKVLAVTIKEITLLRRDSAGLLILFLMPALLVIVITLVQENVMELTGQKKTQTLFLDLDEGILGNLLRQQLGEVNIEIIAWDSKKKKSTELQQAIADGDFQVGIVLEEGSSANFQNNAHLLFQKSDQAATDVEVIPVPVSVFFDPGIMSGFRAGLEAQIKIALETITMQTKVENLARQFNTVLGSMGVSDEYALLSVTELSRRISKPLLTLEDKFVDSVSAQTPPYNPVQQNVPAWAIFGMFFTSIPIAGTILQERNSGIWIRLSSLPVSHLQLFFGKILAYIGVCLVQFILISLIGFFVFPFIGLPAFTVFQNLPGVVLTILCISLAACGFGILLGIISNTYEQASALGASFVVTAAALGGVMVPIYAMPEIMQHLSIISPLSWGLTAFEDMLVRGHSLTMIFDDLARLTLFFLVSVVFAWKLSQTRI